MNNEIRELRMDELDSVSGAGGDPNYKECVNGTTAGGPPGLYPIYVHCNGFSTGGTVGTAAVSIGNSIAAALGGRPA